MLRAIRPYKKKPPRPFSTRYIEARLDELTSAIVRLRGKGCVTCPAITNLTCGHLFTRTWRPTRWDIEPVGNCHVQCERCNIAHESDPRPFISYYIKTFGKRAYNRLATRANSHDKLGYVELFDKWQEYKMILKSERAA